VSSVVVFYHRFCFFFFVLIIHTGLASLYTSFFLYLNTSLYNPLVEIRYGVVYRIDDY